MNKDHLSLARGMFDLFAGPVSLELKTNTKPIVKGLGYEESTPSDTQFRAIMIGQWLVIEPYIRKSPNWEGFNVREWLPDGKMSDGSLHEHFENALKAAFVEYARSLAGAFIESA